jgi:hypothetical protein
LWRDIHDIGARVLSKLSLDTYTHRGMRGHAERGKYAGGAAYGYAITPVVP